MTDPRSESEDNTAVPAARTDDGLPAQPGIFKVESLAPPPEPPPLPQRPIFQAGQHPPLPPLPSLAREPLPPPSDRDSLVANVVAVFGSVSWLGFCVAYVSSNGGWDRLVAYTPLDLAALVAVGLLPLAVLWLFVAHFTRGSQVAVETELLRRQIEQLVYAESDAATAARAGRSGETLRDQAAAFDEASSQATARAEALEAGLRKATEALQQAMDRLDGRSAVALDTLTRAGTGFDEITSQAIRRAEELQTRLKGQGETLDASGARAESHAQEVCQLVARQVDVLESAVSRSLERAVEAADRLRSQAAATEQAGDRAADRLDASAARLTDSLARLGQQGVDLGTLLGDKAAAIDLQLEHQRANFSQALEPLIQHGSEIAAALEQRVRSVSGVLEGQQAMLANLAKGLEDHAGRAQVVLRDQSAGFEQVAAQLLDRVHGVESSLNARVGEFSAATELALQRFDEVGQMAEHYGDTMRQAAQSASADALKIGQDLRARREEVSGTVDAAMARIQAVNAALSLQIQAVDVAQKQMAEGSRALGLVLTEQADTYARGGEQAVEAAEAIRGRLQAEIDQMGGATRLIFRHAEGLAEMAERVNSVVDGIGGRISQGTLDLTGAAETLRNELGHTDGLLAHLLDVVGRANDGLAKAGRELRRSSADIVAAADQAEASISGVGKALDQQVEAVGRGCGSAGDMLHALGQTLAAQAGEVDHVAQRALAQAESAGELLARFAHEFEETSTRSSTQATAAGDSLRLGIRDLGTTADRVTMQLRAAGDTLRRQADDLGVLGGETGERLDGLFDSLREKVQEVARISDEVIGQGESVAAGFSRQIEELSHAVDAAEVLVQRLEKRADAVSVERFLQEAAHIVERLQSLSVDIARVFPQGVDDKTWREFHSGDRSAFLRKVLRHLDRHQINAIRGRFEEDREFRDYVNHYLTEYEGLLTRVRNSERADVLTAVFSSAEVGKLYLVLARALGRLEG